MRRLDWEDSYPSLQKRPPKRDCPLHGWCGGHLNRKRRRSLEQGMNHVRSNKHHGFCVNRFRPQSARKKKNLPAPSPVALHEGKRARLGIGLLEVRKVHLLEAQPVGRIHFRRRGWGVQTGRADVFAKLTNEKFGLGSLRQRRDEGLRERPKAGKKWVWGVGHTCVCAKLRKWCTT